MIEYIKGNLLDSNAEALVNTVNTQGVMGKGIALHFKQQFPNNFRIYVNACKNNEVKIGKLLVTEDRSLLGGLKTIINFPTKTSWRKPSEYSYIEEGLEELKKIILDKAIKSIVIPPLGSGNGGLNWNQVKILMENSLSGLDCAINIYEPSVAIQEALKKVRVKLTPARAMLLALLYELVRNGEFVSEFAAEKIAYFLQRFGAKDAFKLDYSPNFYGPYSGKVKHVLFYLNGSYIMGYSSKDKKPFEELGLIPDGEEVVADFLNEPENVSYKSIVDKTKKFLLGFYSPFGLELLSTIDFIREEKKAHSYDSIAIELENWSDRKKTMFKNQKFVKIAVSNIEKHFGGY